MLEQLFGSKTRVKLLSLFLNNPEKAYFVREITRKTGTPINAIRRELSNLEEIGLLKTVIQPAEDKEIYTGRKKKKTKSQGKMKKFYQADIGFTLYAELHALILKSQFLLEKNLIDRLQNIGSVHYLVLTGFFVGVEDAPTDLLVVGKVSKDKLGRVIKQFERILGHDLGFTVMSKKEFKYRKDITDRFLYSILEKKKIVVVEEVQ